VQTPTYLGGGEGAGASSTPPQTAMDKLFGQINQMKESGASMDDMLKLVPETFRGYIKGLDEGRALPGNIGRNSSARQTIMALAQAMGLDEGQIKAKMQFAQDLGNTKSGLGFRIESGKKMLNHMESLTDNILKQNNFDVPGNVASYIPGIATATQVLNARRNSPPEQRALANEVRSVGQSFALEKGRFLGGPTGGSMHEREKTVDAYNPDAPRSNLVGALQGDLDLFKGQFGAMESQRDTLLGPNEKNPRFTVTSPAMQEQMQRIQDKITKLSKGGAGADAAPAAAFTPPAGWQFSPSRKQYRDPSGKLYDANGKPL